MVDKMIIDADLCIKLGGSEKHHFLYDVLPLISNHTYMHNHTYGEVMMSSSAVNQLKSLVNEGKVVIVNESDLDSADRAVYDASYRNFFILDGIVGLFDQVINNRTACNGIL